MLSSLQIENVAVIQKAEVHFKPGLNVLTGETGAGKSILIDSINAILGNRTSKDLVRTGASKAVIRAAFEEVPGTVLDSLEKAGYERSDALMLSREITAEGKSTCRINGMPATAAVLRELCGGLININGQHDSVGLLNPARHLGILDDYAQNSAEFQDYYVLYRELVRIKRELDAMITDEAEKQRRIDLLSYQVQEIEDAGLTAILGCGFDPGVSGIYTAYAAKHHFDEIQYLDIVDCNAGNHHKAFATNFNPEINIREITQNGRYYENGEWVTTKPLEIHKDLTYPNIGPRDSYLLYHEELESLVKNFPTIKRARFWMTFGQEYLTHLRVIQNIGMARIDEVEYNGMKIVPLQFLKAVLPNPQDLGENYEGETSIGCRIRGLKDGKERTYYVYNNCSHQEAYKETGMQGVSYTTGVPAMIGAMMFLKGLWKKPGVWNVEEFNPDPFMEQLNKQGLPWHEIIDGDLEV